MSKLFEEMAQGTAEVRAYMEGDRKGYKVTLRRLWTCAGCASACARDASRKASVYRWMRYVIGSQTVANLKLQPARFLLLLSPTRNLSCAPWPKGHERRRNLYQAIFPPLHGFMTIWMMVSLP